jgi:RNA polymerase sigma-70 factor (ECF subfamily)
MEFEALYDRYARRLLGWAARRTDPAEAADLTQEAWIALYRALPSYRGEGELDAFVFGVARNVWRVQVRARGRLKRAGRHVPLDEVAPSDLLDPRTPAEPFEEERSLARIDAAGRAELGADEWRRLVRYALEDADLDALERESGASRAALKSRLSRSRRQLLLAWSDTLPT